MCLNVLSAICGSLVVRAVSSSGGSRAKPELTHFAEIKKNSNSCNTPNKHTISGKGYCRIGVEMMRVIRLTGSVVILGGKNRTLGGQEY